MGLDQWIESHQSKQALVSLYQGGGPSSGREHSVTVSLSK